jgi:translation initiation factor IF-3
LNRPFSPRSSSSGGSFIKVNGKIRAREVRVIGVDGSQLGVLSLQDALNQARNNGVDLVEIAPTANPPVCRLVDFGKFRYEQSKKEKESKKRQHATKVKEIQLSPGIDPHDLGVKLNHAIEFLCEDMKVKVTLKFRGREMAHKEFGFQKIEGFIKKVAPWGHPDAPPKLVGKGIVLMISPLPRNKRAKDPRPQEEGGPAPDMPDMPDMPDDSPDKPASNGPSSPPPSKASFGNTPFSGLDVNR